MVDPSESSLGGQVSTISRPSPFFPSARGLELYVDLGVDSGEEGMMQEFHSPPVTTCGFCELELADILSFVDRHRQGSSCLAHHERHLWHEPHCNCSSDEADERRNSQVCSTVMGCIALNKLDTTTMTAGCCGMHDHDQEERESTTLVRSLSGRNISSAADDVVDVACYESGLRGNGWIDNPNSTKDSNSSGASPEIECFDVADISAACLLLEMNRSNSGGVTEEFSQQQPDFCDRIIRVSDFYNDSTNAFQLVSELSDPGATVETMNLAHTEARDEVRTVKETRAALVAYDNNACTTPRDRPPRTELRTYGKKRIKLKKDEREFSVFRINPQVLAEDNYDILDRPLRKRHYKSLRGLLEIK